MIKTPSKPIVEENINLMKTIYNKPRAGTVLNDEIFKVFLTISGTRQS